MFTKPFAIIATTSAFAMLALPQAVQADPGGVPGIHVDVKNIRKHQAALQKIADENGGTRASGTAGYDKSVDFVKAKLMAAGITATEQVFDFPFFQELSPSQFDQVAPVATAYVNGTDFATMDYAGAGDVTANLQAVDVVPIADTDPPSTSTSGCEAADFAGFVPGGIALLQRGTCTFALKAENALAAGAVAAVIYNEGQPGRDGLLQGTLGGPIALPVIGTTAALGEGLVAALGSGDVTVRVRTDTESEIRQTKNLIAELPGGRNDRVVVVGAHLDSVLEGPGIQDNGSGSAMNLEIALRMKKHHLRPRNKVRFIWFGGEEAGLLGSEHYVGSLTDSERGNIMLNLNFDMVASPNFVRFVYDGDGSDTPNAGPPGSDEIEAVFRKAFSKRGLAVEPTAFDGRSDYGPFILAGIPAGGLFTGAEAIKTPEQQAVYGGTAGEALDPCYHQACDTYENNNTTVFRQMTRAAASTIMHYAYKAIGEKKPGKRMQKTLDFEYKGSHLIK